MRAIALVSRVYAINFLNEGISLPQICEEHASVCLLWKIAVSELCCPKFFGAFATKRFRFAYCSKEYRRHSLIRRPADILWLKCKRFIQRMQNNARKYPRKGTWNDANSESETRTWIGDIVSFRKNVNEARRDEAGTALFWDNNAPGKFSFTKRFA